MALNTAGALAATAWLQSHGPIVSPRERWNVEVRLGVTAVAPPSTMEPDETRFHIEIFNDEWGFMFAHGGQSSSIRVTDIAFVHGRDDFHLLDEVPPLRDIRLLVRRLEVHSSIHFRRQVAALQTNLKDLTRIRSWIASL